jgi:hypothetical protein
LTTSIAIGYQWMIELGGLRDTYADAEEIRDDLLRLIYGLWDHTKNHCDRDKERAANYELAWVGYVAGKRENRRLIGDYVLTQNDIGDQTSVSRPRRLRSLECGRPLLRRVLLPRCDGPASGSNGRALQGCSLSIPFRCLYSKNVDNLLMAGKEHLGQPSGNVQHTRDADLRDHGPRRRHGGRVLRSRGDDTPRRLSDHLAASAAAVAEGGGDDLRASGRRSARSGT